MSSKFLFADPSFLSGLARIGDIGGFFDRYNVSNTPAEADIRAMASDWATVAQDLGVAMEHFAAQHAEILAASEAAMAALARAVPNLPDDL